MGAIIRSIAIATFSIVSMAQAFAGGAVASASFESKHLKRTWVYDVYLPEGYADGKQRLPVLYFFHGTGGRGTDWFVKGGLHLTLDNLIASGAIPPTIVVSPDAGKSWYVDRAEQMETAILEDLIPEVQRRFRTIESREGRLLAGHSMGGYGVLRFVLEHPDRFAAAALMSPAIYADQPASNSTARTVGVFGSPDFDPAVWKSLSYPAQWDAFMAQKQTVPMFISSGDDDTAILAESVQLYTKLVAAHQPAELRVVNGAHVWPVWAGISPEALTYIYRYARRPSLP